MVAGGGLAALALEPGTTWAASPVLVSPTTVSLTEGMSTTGTIRLDEPIIAQGPQAGYVNVAISSSDSSRVAVVPGTVSYSAAEWAQAKTFTISALRDGIHNSGDTMTVTLTATSNAPYFHGYSTTMVVTLVDVDPAPSVTPTLSPDPTASPSASPAATASPSPRVARVAPKRSPSPTVAAASASPSPGLVAGTTDSRTDAATKWWWLVVLAGGSWLALWLAGRRT